MEQNETQEPAAPAAAEQPTTCQKTPQRGVPALPRFRSHKVVEAAKIVSITAALEAGGYNLQLESPGLVGEPIVNVNVITVGSLYMTRHDPKAGGYYVRYADGYESWSPAEAFEQGYMPVLAARAEPRRLITTHHVNDANLTLAIAVLDDPGPGGAPHRYGIRGFNASSNPSIEAVAFDQARELEVLFQNGAIGAVGVNGVTHEALLAIVIDRLRSFEQGPHACDENRCALNHLEYAVRFLHARTKRRAAAGTEGTQQGA